MTTKETPIYLVLTLSLVAAVPSATAQERVDAMCFLEGIEPESEDSLMRHKLEVEIRCAATDRMVIDVANFDLQLLDCDRDLIAAGVAWKETHLENNPGDDFFSSEPTNAISISETGRERSVQLRAHTHALPETGVVRIEGSVDLVVEADCVGRDARDPATVQATADALRNATAVPTPQGGEIMSTDQGSSGDAPMLGITGDGSYVGLIEPPAGVREMVFFGKKRIVIGTEVDADAEITLQICPTEIIQVPVSIEAAV